MSQTTKQLSPSELRAIIQQLLNEDSPTYPPNCPAMLAAQIDVHHMQSRETLAEMLEELDDLEAEDDVEICDNCGGCADVGRHWLRVAVDQWVCRSEQRYNRD